MVVVLPSSSKGSACCAAQAARRTISKYEMARMLFMQRTSMGSRTSQRGCVCGRAGASSTSTSTSLRQPCLSCRGARRCAVAGLHADAACPLIPDALLPRDLPHRPCTSRRSPLKRQSSLSVEAPGTVERQDGGPVRTSTSTTDSLLAGALWCVGPGGSLPPDATACLTLQPAGGLSVCG